MRSLKRSASVGEGLGVGSGRRVELKRRRVSVSENWRPTRGESGEGQSEGEDWADAEDVEVEHVVPHAPPPPPQPPTPPQPMTPPFSPPHQIPGFEPSQFYTLRQDPPKKWNKVISKQSFSFTVEPLPEVEGVDPLDFLLAIGAHALEPLLRRAGQGDRGVLIAENPNFHSGIHYTGVMPVDQLDFKIILDRLAAVLQSDESVTPEETTFSLVTYPPSAVGARPTGLGRRHEYHVQDFLRNKRCFIDPLVKNFGRSAKMSKMCLPLCIAMGVKFYALGCQYHKKGKGDGLLREFRRQVRAKSFEQETLDLVARAGFATSKGPFTLAQAEAFQKTLGDEYQVCIYTSNEVPTHFFGPSKAQRHINLFVQSIDGADYHAVFINSMAAFTGNNRFCESCKKGYNERHWCEAAGCGVCRLEGCENTGPVSTTPPPRCSECNESWKTQACFDAHKKTYCAAWRRCLLCWDLSRTSAFDKHPCGQVFCHSCGRRHLPMEYCYVHAAKGKAIADETMGEDLDEASEQRVLYADAETYLDSENFHQANLFVVQGPDAKGKLSEWVYKGDTATDDFVQDLIKKKSPFVNANFFFHNGGRFDCHLIHSKLIGLKMPPKIIAKGQSILIMRLQQNKIDFRDSLQFVAGTPLKAFPKNFGLNSGDKGYFPHKLNGSKWVKFESEDWAYEEGGERFPAAHYFHPEVMRPKERADFQLWHKEEAAKYIADPSKRYLPAKELLKYCRQDVRILRQGFEKYRQEWLSQFPDMDPADYITFPQYNNALLRNKYMEKESLALLPPLGFEMLNNRNSRQCYGWLCCVKAELREAGVEVVLERSGRKGGEVSLAGIRVDGFFRDSLGRQHVFQYQGCHFHGCPDCTQTPSDESIQRYRETLEKSQRLRELSFNPDSPFGEFVFHEMWEHEFRQWYRKGHRHSERLKKFNRLWRKEALRPRDAFFGGRTNAIKHSIPHVPEGYRLAYVDFTSLYPAVMYGTAGQLWPIGFPKIYIGLEVEEEAPTLADAFGLWRVKVHPPPHLRHPVLPQSIGDKLVFALCRTCAETEHQGFCAHSRDQRAIHGTFFTEELKKAQKMGYQLDSPEEVWEWPPEQRSKEMYRPMIRDQYKKKVVSSPYQTEEEIKEAMEELEEMGIEVHRNDFVPNQSMRALAKFSLNNIWGFLGKRSNPDTTVFITEPSQLYAIDDDPKKETLLVNPIDGHMAQVTWRLKKEEAARKGNIVHALMTTAYGRLQLYKLLADFPEEVIYFDTDSAFLLLPPGKAGPDTSNRLGDLKNEVKVGERIVSFHSSGPKSYGYKKKNTEGRVVGEELKAKGIQLTSAASGVAHLEGLQSLVEDHQRVLKVPQWQIGRTLYKGVLFNRDYDKRFRFSSTKRWIIPNSPTQDSLPYGYVSPQL